LGEFCKWLFLEVRARSYFYVILITTNREVLMQIRSLKKQVGQGMTEYIIIVALIAVAAIAVYQLFGSVVRNQTAAIAQEVAGGDGTANKDKAGTDATTAGSNAQTAHTLSSYTGNAAAGQ
jgi:Flp pilus assembly pilin Flp